jgi:hypothetical protein
MQKRKSNFPFSFVRNCGTIGLTFGIGLGVGLLIKLIHDYFYDSLEKKESTNYISDTINREHDIISENSTFECPITQEIMKDPVITPDGITYERAAIVAWINKNKNCPITRKPLKEEDLIPNYSLKQAIKNHKTDN